MKHETVNTETNYERYSVITEKSPREMVMLRGRGCAWRRCRFCDYHTDFSKDEDANFALNKRELEKVTGAYHHLEVINSGSFIDLDSNTMSEIRRICVEKDIPIVHFECHWIHREEIPALKAFFAESNITVKVRIGVETFDYLFRESYLMKGIECDDPKEIASYFDEVCLLQGIPGQSVASMTEDIETGLAYFERVFVNIMVENSKAIKPDPRVRALFMESVYPVYKDNVRVDILLNNTDFGVGGLRDE